MSLSVLTGTVTELFNCFHRELKTLRFCRAYLHDQASSWQSLAISVSECQFSEQNWAACICALLGGRVWQHRDWSLPAHQWHWPCRAVGHGCSGDDAVRAGNAWKTARQQRHLCWRQSHPHLRMSAVCLCLSLYPIKVTACLENCAFSACAFSALTLLVGRQPVKNWVVGCWHSYLSGARCRLAYVPADATATHCLLLQ